MKNNNLTFKELLHLQQLVLDAFKALPSRGKLPGMNRDLTLEEFRAIAFYKAAATILNQKGLLNECQELVTLEHADSDTVIDEGFALSLEEKKK